MAVLHFACSSFHPALRRQLIAASSSSSSSRPWPTSASHIVPARDRVIDFGKHKGRMLGTLPSKYLLWVSRNLRAGDFEQWARLADEVLRDPVYRDRLEWESAERVLTGDDRMNSRSDSPVADILEVSGQFGWDNEDKAGWEKVDFNLLGTSRGGRIPRIGGNEKKDGVLEEESGVAKRGKVRFLSKGDSFCLEDKMVVSEGREERRERQRLRREEEMRRLRREVGAEAVGGRSNGGFMERRRTVDDGGVVNPFPGRKALLDKIKRKQED